ncbi:transposase [Nakamurella alba]|uniref:transposase n=1 Tax=Nakamurella alba TaxID=2665158 RepID=UPI003898DA61
MSDTLVGMTSTSAGWMDQQQFAQALVAQARQEGRELIGPGGQLTGLTKQCPGPALEAEMTDHLGDERHQPAGRNGENSRNGTRSKTVFNPDRACADRGAPGPGRLVRAGDRAQAAAAADRGGSDRVVADGAGPDYG